MISEANRAVMIIRNDIILTITENSYCYRILPAVLHLLKFSNSLLSYALSVMLGIDILS